MPGRGEPGRDEGPGPAAASATDCDDRGGRAARGIAAIDWASRPYGQNSFAQKPSAVIGASPGAIGTAIAQQQLRSVLGFCNSPQMNAPEAYIQFKPGLITDDGEVTVESTKRFLHHYMAELHRFIVRVYTVLPRSVQEE